jgi:hypothetical protein
MLCVSSIRACITGNCALHGVVADEFGAPLMVSSSSLYNYYRRDWWCFGDVCSSFAASLHLL